MNDDFLSGFIAVTGRPNVGKSTLLNLLTGMKIAAVSNKPQTTRNKIQGVVTGDGFQAVFIDTPGIHKPKKKLDVFMQHCVDTAVSGVDVVYYIIEPDAANIAKDRKILEDIDENYIKFLVINKIDTVKESEILPVIGLYSEIVNFAEIIPISALTGDNKEHLLSVTKRYLKKGPMYFPEDYITDQPERRIVAEIIREKALRFLNEEVPHGIAVEISIMKKRKKTNITDIDAVIYCEKVTHKGIIIGKNGDRLKQIGTAARYNTESLLGMRVNLNLWVKVKENWRDNDYLLRSFGYSKKCGD